MSHEYDYDDREDVDEDINEIEHECDNKNECECNKKDPFDDDFEEWLDEKSSDDFIREFVEYDEEERKDNHPDIDVEIIEENKRNYFEKHNNESQAIKSQIETPSKIIPTKNAKDRNKNIKSTSSNDSISTNLLKGNKTLDNYFKKGDNSEKKVTIRPNDESLHNNSENRNIEKLNLTKSTSEPSNNNEKLKLNESIKNSDILKGIPEPDIKNIDPKLRELFPDIFENPRSDPWKFWLSMTHASSIISDIIEQRRLKSIRSISNFEPFPNFINALKREHNSSANKLQQNLGKIPSDEQNYITELKNYINISEYIKKNVDSKEKIKDLFQSHPYQFSFKNIGDLFKISDTAAGNSLKKIFTKDELNHLLKSKKSVLIDLRKIVKTKNGKIISVAQDAKAKDRVTLQCSYKHKWETSIDSVLYMNTWCPTCYTFVGEKVCRKTADEVFNGHFRKYKPGSLPWLVNSRGNGMELDGYDPKLRIAIEYQGRFHYENDRTNMSDDELEQRIEDDVMKKELCSQNNILLIQIPYTVDMENFDKYMLNEYNKNASQFEFPQINSTKDIDIKTFDIYQNKDAEKFENYVSEKGGRLITPYIAAKEKVTLECEHGHQWTTTPDSIYQKNWCSVCAGNKKLDQVEFQEMLSQHGFTLESELANARTEVKIKCKNEHITQITPDYLRQKIKNNKEICTSCKTKKFEEELTQHGLTLLEEIPNFKYNAWLKCKNDHVFNMKPSDIKKKIKNNQEICPYCEN